MGNVIFLRGQASATSPADEHQAGAVELGSSNHHRREAFPYLDKQVFLELESQLIEAVIEKCSVFADRFEDCDDNGAKELVDDTAISLVRAISREFTIVLDR